ncbi:MAG TPA: Dam family site-specific DNA-(adenine-N6)-methyltransferase [Verrucomicrobiae bacterium]|nr:Dam family site-specific DNA-(adenine-N6)-methyltransferase [Verrucomicrobiae bacterium]
MKETQSAASQLHLDGNFEKLKPLFRWAGGKRRLLSQILPLIPKKYNHYYEPFCGGAALFFELNPANATLGDTNEELINCYKQVKASPEEVIAALRKLENIKADYYKIRGKVPTSLIERAARLFYLMELSFNGIYRVNSSGEFNVPYGDKADKKFDFERIRSVSKSFAATQFVCGDFAMTVKNAKEGDLVYFDPPYTVAHGNNGFIQYNERIFSWAGQIRLAKLAEKLAQRGCYVIISNAAHASIAEIYSSFKTQTVVRHSAVGGLPKARKHIAEFVFTK